MKEDVLLVSDTTFKYMFKHNAYKRRMIDVIKYLTNIDLSNYEFINTEVNTGTKKIKDKRMDLVFRNDNHIVIIEMEQFYHLSNEIKDYEYLYSVAGSSITSGEKYTNNKTTLVLFTNYVSKTIKHIDELLIDYKFMNAKYNIIKERIESYEIILPNFHKMNYNDCNKFEKFLWLFSCKTIDEMKSIVDNDEDKEIIRELERLNMDDNFRFEYDHEAVQKKLVNSVRAEGFDEGLEQGLEQGTKEERIRSIKSFYANGVSVDIIAKTYDISIEEVNSIIDTKE